MCLGNSAVISDLIPFGKMRRNRVQIFVLTTLATLFSVKVLVDNSRNYDNRFSDASYEQNIGPGHHSLSQ